jgi:hypothetical protein
VAQKPGRENEDVTERIIIFKIENDDPALLLSSILAVGVRPFGYSRTSFCL